MKKFLFWIFVSYLVLVGAGFIAGLLADRMDDNTNHVNVPYPFSEPVPEKKLTTEWGDYYVMGKWEPKGNLMEQKYIELGLRSDGMVTWRKVGK